MSVPIGPLPLILGAGLAVWLGTASIRWAKRHSRGAQVAASALLLLLGLTVPVVQPPPQRIEEAREDTGKKDAQSGGPAEDPGALTP